MSIEKIFDDRIYFWEISPEGYVGTNQYDTLKKYCVGLVFYMEYSDKASIKFMKSLLTHIKLASTNGVKICRPNTFYDEHDIKQYEMPFWFKSFADKSYVEELIIDIAQNQ